MVVGDFSLRNLSLSWWNLFTIELFMLGNIDQVLQLLTQTDIVVDIRYNL